MKILSALAFWFAVAVAAIALSGLHAWMNEDASVTPVWRSA